MYVCVCVCVLVRVIAHVNTHITHFSSHTHILSLSHTHIHTHTHTHAHTQLEHECAQVRMSHQEAAANVAGMPALQQHLQQLQQDLQQSQALNTALKVCEEYNVHMRTELRDLHVRLPRAEAALQEMQGERDVCLEDKRKSDEAQQVIFTRTNRHKHVHICTQKHTHTRTHKISLRSF